VLQAYHVSVVEKREPIMPVAFSALESKKAAGVEEHVVLAEPGTGAAKALNPVQKP